MVQGPAGAAAPVGKLRFSIHSVSGEDPDYPARELLYHSAHTRGWQTPRFCRYPQEVVLRLDRPSRVQQIQILSHEYKIAQRLEIFVGTLPPGEDDVSRCAFKRLGHLSFHSNEKTNFQARELKTVHVSHAAHLVKLSLQGPHMNQHNIYNQVSLVAVNLLGDAFGDEVPEGPASYGAAARGGGALGAPPRDLALEMDVDSVTAAQIRDLHAQKSRAIAEEDYDRAKELKAAVDRLREVGRKVAQLEAKKRAAVEREDYDEAKALKQDIEKLRAAGPAASLPQRAPGGDVLSRLAGADPGSGGVPAAVYDEIPVAPASPGGGDEADPGSPAARPAYHPPEDAGPDSVPPPGRQASQASLTPREYDERPAIGKGAYNVDARDDGGLGAPGGAPAAPRLPKPPGYDADLPDPEELSPAAAGDAQGLIACASEFTARCAYSKQHKLREAALQVLEKDLSAGRLTGAPRDLLRTLARLAGAGCQDRISNVYMAAVGLLRAAVTELAPKAGGRDVAAAVADAVPALVDKAEDSNTRLRAAAAEMLLLLASVPEVGVAGLERALLKKMKSSSAVKPMQHRLSLLKDLLSAHGSSADGSRGFNARHLLDFLGPQLNSPSGDVRKAAVTLIADVVDETGIDARGHLPSDVNPKIQEDLDAALGGQKRGAPAAARPAPAARAPAPARGAAGRGGRGGAGAGRGAGGRGGRGGGRGAPAPAPAPAPEPSDDPAAYERELKLKEEEFGPDHEEVAEACSNLAILYNQGGDFDKARPLYERALRIWSRAKGEDSADVAHTLTDLAVLYLEQGDDDRGRPLLERALRIQERELGPDHPDVQAIRDVLQSDD